MIRSDEAWSVDPWFEFRRPNEDRFVLAEKFGSFPTVGILFNFISILIGQFLSDE